MYDLRIGHKFTTSEAVREYLSVGYSESKSGIPPNADQTSTKGGFRHLSTHYLIGRTEPIRVMTIVIIYIVSNPE